jgi:hypothetical protein
MLKAVQRKLLSQAQSRLLYTADIMLASKASNRCSGEALQLRHKFMQAVLSAIEQHRHSCAVARKARLSIAAKTACLISELNKSRLQLVVT